MYPHIPPIVHISHITTMFLKTEPATIQVKASFWLNRVHLVVHSGRTMTSAWHHDYLMNEFFWKKKKLQIDLKVKKSYKNVQL